MQFGVITGTVVASQKVSELTGVPLKLMVPCDENRKPIGKTIVVADAIGARSGDLIMWVGKREASMAFSNASIKNNIPLDAAVTGIVDEVS